MLESKKLTVTNICQAHPSRQGKHNYLAFKHQGTSEV